MFLFALAVVSAHLALGDLVVPVQPKSDTAGCEGGVTKGAISIGGISSAYMAGENGTVHGSTLTLQHNSGMSVLSSCEKHWEPDSIMQFKLLGRTLRFTVDLSKVGCACNLAFYLIAAPALDMRGNFHRGSDRGGQPPYYCDANQVGGQWCPEIDIMEANNRVFQATLHKCDEPTNGHYEYCDRSGCAENTKDIRGSYGPGKNFTINTLRPFEVHTEFLENDGVLTGMRTVLEQAERHVVMNHSNCVGRDLSALSAALRHGMSIRATYWGGDAQMMSWMDAPPCGRQACSGENAGDGVISDISVSDKVWKHFEAPQPKPAQAQWSQAAATSSWQQPQAWKPQENEQQQQWKPQEQQQWKPQEQQQQQQWKPEEQPWQQWQPQEQNQGEPDEHVPMRWVADEWAPWECHNYVDPEQQKSDWCAEVGFSEGYEFHYNGGVESECSPCWCCKRRAKQVPAETTTGMSTTVHTTRQPTSTSTATSTYTTTTAPARENRLVWVVSDPKDAKFGKVVPESIIADPDLFVFADDQGVVNWEHKGRAVRQMKGSEIDALLRKAKRSRSAGGGASSQGDGGDDEVVRDCDEDGQAPCQTSMRSEASYFDVVLQKYSAMHLPAVGGAAGHLLAAAAAALLVAALLVGGVALMVRRGLRSRQRRVEEPLALCEAGPCQAAADAGAAPAWCGASPLALPAVALRRSRSGQRLSEGSRQSAGLPGLPRASSSCQRLLALAENLA